MLQGSDGREELHGRRRTHGLPVVMHEENRVGREIPDHQSQLRGLQQWSIKQPGQPLLYIQRPGQIKRQGIAYHRVGFQQSGVFALVELRKKRQLQQSKEQKKYIFLHFKRKVTK